MDLVNHEFGEVASIQMGLLQGTQLDAAGNGGLWVSLRDYYKAVVLIETSGGTASDDLVISVNQATSNAGAGSKALSCVQRWRMMQAAALNQSAGGVYTLNTQSLGSSFTATGSAGQQSLVVFEINAHSLDATGGYYFVQASIAQTAQQCAGADEVPAILAPPASGPCFATQLILLVPGTF